MKLKWNNKTKWVFCRKCQRVVTFGRHGGFEVVISDCKCSRNPTYKEKRYMTIGFTKNGRLCHA